MPCLSTVFSIYVHAATCPRERGRFLKSTELFYFSLKNIEMGTPLKSKNSRILFSKKFL